MWRRNNARSLAEDASSMRASLAVTIGIRLIGGMVVIIVLFVTFVIVTCSLDSRLGDVRRIDELSDA